MRMERCPDCGNHIDINSDHAIGCEKRQNVLYFQDDGTPVMETKGVKHCPICGDVFMAERDTWDHGHDSHGFFHFQDPTVGGPLPPDFIKPITYEEEYDRAEAWRIAYWTREP